MLNTITSKPLEVIEQIARENASAENIYAGDGVRLRDSRRTHSRTYLAKRLAVQDFIEQVMEGRRPMYHLREVMSGEKEIDGARFGLRETLSTSDFSNLFGDILDRALLDQYTATESQWRAYVRRSVVNDFRTAKRFTLDGIRQPLDAVAQLAAYPAGNVSDGAYSLAVAKHGRTIGFSWEAIINDDLNAFSRIPQLMSESAVNSEEKYVAQLLVDASGFLTAFFTSGNGNILTTALGSSAANTALSQQGIEDAWTVLNRQVDSAGDPIMVRGAIIVVPRALEITAMKLVNQIQSISFGPGGSTSTTANVISLNVAAWQRRLSVAVNPYLDIVNTTNGKTTWFMFADPNTGRGSLELAFLRGHENPELFIKSPNARRLGGGEIDPLDGNFESDAVEWKLRHTYGGTTLDPRGVVASNGTGS